MANIFRRSISRKTSERSTPSARIWFGSLIDNGKNGVSDLIANEFFEAPAITYYGILKRWTGSWAKALLKIYSGSWITKPLKRWSGTEWLTVNSSGV